MRDLWGVGSSTEELRTHPGPGCRKAEGGSAVEMQELGAWVRPQAGKAASTPLSTWGRCHHAWRRNVSCFTHLLNAMHISLVASPYPRSYREVISLLSVYTVKSRHRALESTRAIISLWNCCKGWDIIQVNHTEWQAHNGSLWDGNNAIDNNNLLKC